MRFSNICDSINSSGCPQNQNYSPVTNFIYNYQIELGFLFAFILIVITIYLTIKSNNVK